MKEAMVSPAALKRADTTSSIGAGVLGAGLALLVADRLTPYAIPIFAIGLVMHVWGMVDKHRLQSRAPSPRLWWAELLYWGCWLGLLFLLGYILVARR
jgi:hypothetical protein